MEHLSSTKIFGGLQSQYKHQSVSLNCEMVFSVYMPTQSATSKVPVLYWLSGLTCSDQNFVTKAGAQRYADQHGIAIVCPDTSPRGEGVADDSDGAYDLGLGAGFYINATQAPWSEHYAMYDYVVSELPELINANFPIDGSRAAISGHSMGGHGALIIALNNPEKYKSVSAFAPIVSPINCPWGEKALGNYLGSDTSTWLPYDTCTLIKSATSHLPILVDQGTADNFLKEQLKTERLEHASKEADYPMSIRYQDGYDHSYFFISSFIGEHIEFHAEHLMSIN
ncbi:MAG: S-formylglutathione hydrolase [Arenicella sp.]|jgi:S-formylglutathione hydrolase